jgi:sterol desaturase/sphingolipid hydroxylase (fatty acid hydroxylase superfamily)
MTTFEAMLRAEFESLQYAAFFGALVVLGLLEAVLAVRNDPASRRKRWPANFGLTAINVLVLGALPLGSLAAADLAAARGWGLLNQVALPAWLAVVAAFLLRSLTSYGIHVAMHKVPLLWRLHRIHHTDTAMDISTAVRFHPFEFVVSIPAVLAATVAFGLPPAVVLLYSLVDAAMAVFSHANIRLPGPIERGLRLVLMTPGIHRLHHAAAQPETDSNYGSILSCWDRLFGTYRSRPEAELTELHLGLSEHSEDNARSLWWLLALPFRPARRSARPEPRPAVGARRGWRPADRPRARGTRRR